MRALAIAWVMLVGCAPANEPSAAKAAPRASASIAASAPAMPRSQTFDAEHAAAIAKNPPGVTLGVRPAGGQTRFVEGQPIVLELYFASARPNTYQLDMGTYDRSGRLWSESFRFDPADRVVDPLADYFGEMRGGMGGIRAMPAKLSTEPTKVEV